jgi:outer membrane protein
VKDLKKKKLNKTINNIMKKIILIAAMAVISVAATAQNLKFGYVNYTELVQLVPEMDTVREQLEAQEKETYETLGAMYQEYQTKAEQFQQKQSTWTPAIRDSKMKELQEIEARFQENQQIFQQELQQMQQMLQAPVMEKVQNTVTELAKAQGLAFVFEETQMLYIDPAQGVNLTTEARKALNIPEDRTLESLQAELQAKAQAAQAQM